MGFGRKIVGRGESRLAAHLTTPAAEPVAAPAPPPEAAPAPPPEAAPAPEPRQDAAAPAPPPAPPPAAPAPAEPSAAPKPAYAPPPEPEARQPRPHIPAQGADQAMFAEVRTTLFERINVSAAVLAGRSAMAEQLRPVVSEIVIQKRFRLNRAEQEQLVERLLDDMFGLGPLEPLLADGSISDILVNGPNQVYVERAGKLATSNVVFVDNDQLTNIAQRIAASVGRRVDESSPMVDCRLADGSRVNIVVPPLAIDGTSISIRKFSKKKIGLSRMVEGGSMSRNMARLLEIAARCRLNIIISGGTGSGKTTLLNALSGFISRDERIVTIEDAAELQLQQPHVVRLETRPASIEGSGAVDQRALVANALRMRPDRIILGETRGSEAFDVLQAMNTGHDGSMTTIHANNAREALTRLENMVVAGNPTLPVRFVRAQIAGAVQLIVQVSRMRDGGRRVTQILEIAGTEGDVIATQSLFGFVVESGGEKGIKGRFEASGYRPLFTERARAFGLDGELDILFGSAES